MHDEERQVEPEAREIAIPAQRAHDHHRRRRAHARKQQASEGPDDHHVAALGLRDGHYEII